MAKVKRTPASTGPVQPSTPPQLSFEDQVMERAKIEIQKVLDLIRKKTSLESQVNVLKTRISQIDAQLAVYKGSKASGAGRGRKSSVTDEQIISVVESSPNITTGEIARKLGLASAPAGKRLNELKTRKMLDFKKDGKSKCWFKL